MILPLLEREVVAPGWLSHDQFLAGYGAAQALPGPLFTLCAYLGTLLRVGPGGWLGGIWAAAFMRAAIDQSGAYLSAVINKPTNPIFSFGVGLFGPAILAVIVLLLLRDPVLSIVAVSRQVGFNDPNYFSRAFRRHTGMPPRRYSQLAGAPKTLT